MYKKIFSQLITSIVFLIIGIYLGYDNGLSKASNSLTSLNDESVAIRLTNDIKLLKYIRNGGTDSAKEMLESLVDVELNSLSVNVLNKSTKDINIIGAIKEAKEYREKYPDHKPNKVLSKTIEEAFQKISKQQL